MKIRKLIFIFLFIISGFMLTLLYGEDGVSGVISLMPDSFSARAMALGDSFTGIADDINTISVNPAGLNTLNSFEGSFSFMKHFLDMNFGTFAVGTPLPDSFYNGYIGGSFTFFWIPPFEQFDSTGNKKNEKLDASDFVVTIGYANNPLQLLGIHQNFQLGVNIKYIQSRLVEVSKNTFGFDIGALYKMSFFHMGGVKINDNLSVGFSIQNLGSSIKYEQEKTQLPQNIRAGMGYNFYNDSRNRILMGMDINFPNDSSQIINIGMEYAYVETLFLRVGYKDQNMGNLTFGIGGKYDISDMTMRLDYSFIPVQDFESRHVLTLTLKYGDKGREQVDFKIDDKKDRLVIGLEEHKNKLFSNGESEIKRRGYKVLDNIITLIKKENYKSIVIIWYTFPISESKKKLAEQRGESLSECFVERGIKKARIVYMVYEKEQKTDNKEDELKIIVIKWKQGEKEKYEEYFFNGLDAFIKEGYGIAIEEWKKALKIDPDNKDVKRRLKEAKKLLKLKRLGNE